jgi:hypothetical protein
VLLAGAVEDCVGELVEQHLGLALEDAVTRPITGGADRLNPDEDGTHGEGGPRRRPTDQAGNKQLVQFIGAEDVMMALGCSRSFA